MNTGKRNISPERKENEKVVKKLLMNFLGKTRQEVEDLLREENHELLMGILQKISENITIIGERKMKERKEQEQEKQIQREKLIEERRIKSQKKTERELNRTRKQQHAQVKKESRQTRNRVHHGQRTVTEQKESQDSLAGGMETGFYDNLHAALFGHMRNVGTFFSNLNSRTKGDEFPSTQDGWLAWSLGGWGEFLDRLAAKCLSKSTGDESICAQKFLDSIIPRLREDAAFLEKEKFTMKFDDRVIKIGNIFDMYRAIGEAPSDLINLIMMKIKSKGTKNTPLFKSSIQGTIKNYGEEIGANTESGNRTPTVIQPVRLIQGNRYNGKESEAQISHIPVFSDTNRIRINNTLFELHHGFPDLQVRRDDLLINGFGSIVVSSSVLELRKIAIKNALLQLQKGNRPISNHE